MAGNGSIDMICGAGGPAGVVGVGWAAGLDRLALLVREAAAEVRQYTLFS